MSKKAATVILFLVLTAMAGAQGDPPSMRCISVNTDGSVTLNWIKPATSAGFQSYQVFFAVAAAGPYSLAGTVTDYDTEAFDHTAVNALDDSYFYYIITEYASGSSSPSDTLRSIRLLLTSPDPETALLTWNGIHSPPLPSSLAWYRVYMEYPPGNWSFMDSTQQNSYTAKFFECNNPSHIVSFRIELADNSGCSSVSPVKGEVLFNFTKPEIPEMDSVSISPSGDVVIGWQPTPSQDTRGYVIYLVTGTNDSIDFVEGIGNTIYVHLGVDPCQASYTYAISAIDSCGNESPGTFNIPQQTLLIDSIGYDPCLMSNFIAWNPYINFDPPLGEYELWVSENGLPATLLVTLPADSTSYNHENLSSNTTYEYFVRAFSQDGQKSSTSCTKSITTYDSPRPDFLYLRHASVRDNEGVELLFYTDTSAFVNTYRVLRSESPAGPYEETGTLAPTGEENLAYFDASAAVGDRSYYYKITVIDSCDIESEIANTGRTIHLAVEANEDRTNFLSWNGYESWNGGVDSYEVYRLVNSSPDPAMPLAVLSPGTLSYLDDVSFLTGSNSVVEYYIRAIEGDNNVYGFRDEAYSNTALALQESKVFVPNAFAPGGINDTFKPVSSFISADNYLFSIYDRFGRLLFTTTNPGEGWTGVADGKPVPQGVYVYLLRYSDTMQRTVSLTGTVAVLR